MRTPGSILGSLRGLVEPRPTPPPAKRQRGRQATSADKLFVKARIVMLMRRRSTAYAWLSFLDQEDPVAHPMRPWLREHGRFPTRRPWERRSAPLPARLPALLGWLGRPVVPRLPPWAAPGHAAAVARPPVRANGGGWHTPPRLAGAGPPAALATEAAWRTSGEQGWWYGWTRPLAVGVGRVWIPVAAEGTIASDADNRSAPQWLEPWPRAGRSVPR